MNKVEEILECTNRGLLVFAYFLNEQFKGPGRRFLNPLYLDKNPSCYVYLDEKRNRYYIKDFGQADFHGDCFFFVGKLFNLSCESDDFKEILSIIENEVIMNKSFSMIPLAKTSEISKSDMLLSSNVVIRELNPQEIDYWNAEGVSHDTLERFGVVSIVEFHGVSKNGRDFQILSTHKEPAFGYPGNGFYKVYRPNSKTRFLYTNPPGIYSFGFLQLPYAGDLVVIAAGEKDVMNLSQLGINAICFNSESANIPLDILNELKVRFKIIGVLYDVDEAGKAALSKLIHQFGDFDLLPIELPLSGQKGQKDFTDFVKLGFNKSKDIQRLIYDSLMASRRSDAKAIKKLKLDDTDFFEVPPIVLGIDKFSLGRAGDIVCVTGAEGSGKSKFTTSLILRSILGMSNNEGLFLQSNTEGKACVLFDTEQTKYQLYNNVRQAMESVNISIVPDYVYVFSLVEVARQERWHYIEVTLRELYYKHGGIHLIVIDGIADMIDSVNMETPAIKLLEDLMQLASVYSVLVICVIHFLENGMKLRGHLGSELQRKASSILLVERKKTSDSMLIRPIKMRDGDQFKVSPIQF
jgi:hypothetical protein